MGLISMGDSGAVENRSISVNSPCAISERPDSWCGIERDLVWSVMDRTSLASNPEAVYFSFGTSTQEEIKQKKKEREQKIGK